MIQRIQTIWLMLACIASFLTIKFPFFSGSYLTSPQNSPADLLTAFTSIPIAILTVVSAITSLITIFLYKDRKLQMRVTIANLLVSILIIVLYFVSINLNYQQPGVPLITCIFAFLVPIFLFLACRGIYKDNRLVKSVDRLR